ncbi:hypothetical protein CDAR_308281 [Caerostris darwini]|uniref:Uncharacterized protein n=1 Tax=Caerostris darwini TaxID=1538125 RepID=A0AAV4S7T6_9ARAC|nr:hypothetical protein CDAR_308281 [Caerostris darwini]
MEFNLETHENLLKIEITSADLDEIQKPIQFVWFGSSRSTNYFTNRTSKNGRIEEPLISTKPIMGLRIGFIESIFFSFIRAFNFLYPPAQGLSAIFLKKLNVPPIGGAMF